MNQKKWTIEEDNYLKENFGKMTFKEMGEYLCCATSTIQRRAEQLGIKVEKKTIRRWSNEEIELLKVMSSKYLNKTIARKLDRSPQEVNKKARELGIKLIFKRPVWKKWKIKFLKENLNKISLRQIQKELDLNYYQIMEKIEELGLEYNNNRWTEDEEKILIELAPRCYIREIAKVLNRTEEAILTKAQKMELEYITLNKKYTQEELKYIKDNWGIISISEIARNLKVSRNMVQRQADFMQLPRLGNNPYRKWTQEEIEKLRVLASKKSITELARYFKTTNIAIQTVAYHNYIELIDTKIKWTENDINLLKEYAKTMTILEIANKMKRSTSSIRLQIKRLGIEAKTNNKNNVWTKEDSEKLIELIKKNMSLIEIAKIMNKKDQTLKKKARELGLKIKNQEYKEWSEEENNKLRELSKTKKLSELVNELERTSSSIKNQAKKLGVTIENDRKNWSKAELDLLEKLVTKDKKSPQEIALILGRTQDSVILKISRIGLTVQTNDKRFWTKEEEMQLSDLWGSIPIEKLAKKLNRTVSSLRNKAFQLGLGSQIENNYEGLKISDICSLFNVSREVVTIHWVALGLNCKTRNITQVTSYQYVEIKDLYDFLEQNQNIWDSRVLEKNILGIEPQWLKEKRKIDKNYPIGHFGLDNLTKQQLIIARNFFLDYEANKELSPKDKVNKLVRKKDK